MAKSKSPRAKKSAKTSVKKSAIKKQAARDVLVIPTIKQIESSIKQGTTVAASAFRAQAGW